MSIIKIMKSVLSTWTFLIRIFHSANLVIFLLNGKSAASSNDNKNVPKLLVVVFDGFRWDFVNENRTPNLWRYFAREGVWAPRGAKSQFVTLNLPNLYSIFTGLYQETHGIVGEIMFDPEFDEIYDYWNEHDRSVRDNSRDAKWYSGVPIWQANENAGNNRRSGAMRLPLCDSKINNETLFKCEPVTEMESLNTWKNDLETVFQWLIDKEESVNLAIMYLGEPDRLQHHMGFSFFSPDFKRLFNAIDFHFIDHLNDLLTTHNLRDNLNIMFLSDHGMANIFNEKSVINFDATIEPDSYKWSGRSIFPNKGTTVDNLYNKIKQVQNSHLNFHVWLKHEVPDNFHYKNNKRIGPIVVSEYLGYTIVSHRETAGQFPHGKHGYSNEYREMWPMFIASGPAFKKSFKFETDLETIDYYNIMCAVLEIECRPNNGSFKRAHSMLANISPLGQKWLKNEAGISNKNGAVRVLSSETILYRCFLSIIFVLFTKFPVYYAN